MSSAKSNMASRISAIWGASMSEALSSSLSSSSRYRPKRRGLAGHPCLTPILQSNRSVHWWLLEYAFTVPHFCLGFWMLAEIVCLQVIQTLVYIRNAYVTLCLSNPLPGASTQPVKVYSNAAEHITGRKSASL